MMSLKSLFSSFPLNTLPLLLSSPSLALYFSVPLLLSPCSPFLPAPEKLMLFVMMFCSAYLLLQFILCLLQPLTSLSPQSLAFLQITRRPQKKIVFTIFILHQSLESLDKVVSSRPLHCSSPALPLSPCFSLSLCFSFHPALLSTVLLIRQHILLFIILHISLVSGSSHTRGAN